MISVRLDDGLVRAMDEAAQTDQRGRSELVREAVELWLTHRRLAEQVHRHRQGYRRRPVKPDEFSPVLGSQQWPE
jgi:metal-responsive CopG/Arc/MetJ family transcriptional regulator